MSFTVAVSIACLFFGFVSQWFCMELVDECNGTPKQKMRLRFILFTFHTFMFSTLIHTILLTLMLTPKV